MENNHPCLLGETYFRSQSKVFGIKPDDRRRHMYLIGKTGMGKTTMLENMVYSDVINGHGLCYIDPHGDTAEKILDFIPSYRINDVIYFNPADIQYPISFNVLETVEDPLHKSLIASGLIGVFKKIWADSWGPRLEYILRNCLLALLDHPDSTLLGVPRILVDKEFRNKVISNIKDPVVRLFWTKEFTQFNERTLGEVISPIQNKVGQFLSTALIRNIVGQVKTTINFRHIMDDRKILILNLSKGRIGEDSSALLGAMMITKLQLAAMSRVDIPEETRPDFYLYVDEFQNFATESFAGILSEARKYRLNLIVAHQYIKQLNETVADAIFGNVGTMVSFRVGAMDAEALTKEFAPFFNEEDFVNLPKFFIYLKLMIDGIASNPFSAKTLPPLSRYEGHHEKIISVTRERYAKKRDIVEDKILRWSSSNPALETSGSKDSGTSSARPKGKYSYTCNECKKVFDLNVQLDVNKPLFCKECLEIRKQNKPVRQSDFSTQSAKSEVSLKDIAPNLLVKNKIKDIVDEKKSSSTYANKTFVKSETDKIDGSQIVKLKKDAKESIADKQIEKVVDKSIQGSNDFHKNKSSQDKNTPNFDDHNHHHKKNFNKQLEKPSTLKPGDVAVLARNEDNSSKKV